jgi:hypothetical protein
MIVITPHPVLSPEESCMNDWLAETAIVEAVEVRTDIDPFE